MKIVAVEKMKLTESELDILTALWELKEGTVMQVNNIVNDKRENKIVYTTTLKQMQLMFEKALLSRIKSENKHIYKPLISQDAYRESAVKSLINRFFKGSSSQLIIQVLGSGKVQEDEKSAIRFFLNEID